MESLKIRDYSRDNAPFVFLSFFLLFQDSKVSPSLIVLPFFFFQFFLPLKGKKAGKFDTIYCYYRCSSCIFFNSILIF